MVSTRRTLCATLSNSRARTVSSASPKPWGGRGPGRCPAPGPPARRRSGRLPGHRRPAGACRGRGRRSRAVPHDAHSRRESARLGTAHVCSPGDGLPGPDRAQSRRFLVRAARWARARRGALFGLRVLQARWRRWRGTRRARGQVRRVPDARVDRAPGALHDRGIRLPGHQAQGRGARTSAGGRGDPPAAGGNSAPASRCGSIRTPPGRSKPPSRSFSATTISGVACGRCSIWASSARRSAEPFRGIRPRTSGSR